MSTRCDAFIAHVGWLRHECGEEVISLLRQGYFEAPEQAFFWLHGRPGDVFIDGGAHIGLYSIVAHRAAGGGARIIAVEPSETTARDLAANLEANGVHEASIVQAALWKEPGEVRFEAEPTGKAAYAHVAFEQDGGIAVPATTLDRIIDDGRIAQVTLAKIDVEGAEPEVLEGAAQSIAHGALPLLMVEFTEANLAARGSSTQQLRARLERLGYALGELDPATLQLAPFRETGTIWHRNLFACTDMPAVNSRLAAAGTRERAIARDILDRAQACSRFKELEELDRLRAQGDEREALKRWAREADERKIAAEALAQANLEWARRTEAMLAAERESLATQREAAAAARDALSAAESALRAERESALRVRNELADTQASLIALEARIAPLRALATRFPRLTRLAIRWLT